MEEAEGRCCRGRIRRRVGTQIRRGELGRGERGVGLMPRSQEVRRRLNRKQGAVG